MQLENEIQHYRARFGVYPINEHGNASTAVIETLKSWTCGKELRRHSELGRVLNDQTSSTNFTSGSFSFPKEYQGGSSSERRTKLATDAFVTDDNSRLIWALEYDEPDSKLWYRHWHTNVGVSHDSTDTRKHCRVNVRISLYTLPAYIGKVLDPPLANVPNFVKTIIGLSGYRTCVGETIAQPEEIYLDGENFESDFKRNLTDNQRELPLILMVTNRIGATPIWDAASLAQHIMGMANVYVADYRDGKLRDQMFSLFRRDTPAFNCRCNPGMLRVYRPGIDLKDPYGYGSHRYFLQREIESYYDQAYKDLGPNADESHVKSRGDALFANVLSRSLARGIIRDESDVLALADVEAARSHSSVEKLRARYAELSKRVDSARLDERAPYEENVLQKLKDWQQMADEYATAHETEATLRASLQQENVSLTGQVASMSYRLEAAKDRMGILSDRVTKLEREEMTLGSLSHIPTSLAEELDLAVCLWPTRIATLNKARQSAQAFLGTDLDEYWQILSATANVLWPLYFEEGSTDIAGDFKAQTGYELALAEKKLTKKGCRHHA